MGLKVTSNHSISAKKHGQKNVSELTVHNPPQTFHSNPNQPTYVIAIPGRSRGALRAGQALSERLCKATGVKMKTPDRRGAPADRRDGSSYTTLSS